MHPDRHPETASAAGAAPSAPSEQETFAEHRAALDATVFAGEALLELELRDGALLRR